MSDLIAYFHQDVTFTNGHVFSATALLGVPCWEFKDDKIKMFYNIFPIQ